MTGAHIVREHRRSLLLSEWPETDRMAWEAACRPGRRLTPGGAAAYLSDVSRETFARRYGAFLGFLQRTGRLEHGRLAAAPVTVSNVEAYVAELQARVRSVTVYNYIYHLRRASELLAPTLDFSWLAEIEKDLALIAQPRSKFHRLVFTGQLVEAGLTLAAEGQQFARGDLVRARAVRNGLMIALLALCPIRLKNFAALEVGSSFRRVDTQWWIALPSSSTKSRRPDERRVPEMLNSVIAAYVNKARPTLIGSKRTTAALWISSSTGERMTTKNIGILVSKITLETLGVDLSPHLFRTSAASTAAAYGSSMPGLASAVLNHTDPRTTEQHYNRANSVGAAKAYRGIIANYLDEGDEATPCDRT